MNQLTFVGGGRMGEALIAGALRGSFVPADISVVEPDGARAQVLTQSYGVEVSADPASIARSSVVVLAVKPQVLMQVCEQLAPHLSPDTLIISIAAGVRTSALEAALPPGIAVVRVMPNTPACVHAGMSVLSAGSQASEADMARVRQLFEPVGKVLVVDEADQDAVTAISGSGPAYFFYLVEAMEAAAVGLGLSAEVAHVLAVQTARGAGVMVSQSADSAETLRHNVTSPGGTTAAAIAQLDEHQVKQAVESAVKAAHQRSIELS